jgi:hypothetical protein
LSDGVQDVLQLFFHEDRLKLLSWIFFLLCLIVLHN